MESVASRTAAPQQQHIHTHEMNSTEWQLRMLFLVVTIWYRLAPSANDICEAKSSDAMHATSRAVPNVTPTMARMSLIYPRDEES